MQRKDEKRGKMTENDEERKRIKTLRTRHAKDEERKEKKTENDEAIWKRQDKTGKGLELGMGA